MNTLTVDQLYQRLADSPLRIERSKLKTSTNFDTFTAIYQMLSDAKLIRMALQLTRNKQMSYIEILLYFSAQ